MSRQHGSSGLEWMMLGLFFVNKPVTLKNYGYLWLGLIIYMLLYWAIKKEPSFLAFPFFFGIPMTISYYFYLIDKYIINDDKEISIMNVKLYFLKTPIKIYIKVFLFFLIAYSLILPFTTRGFYGFWPALCVFVITIITGGVLSSYVTSKAISEALIHNTDISNISPSVVYSEVRTILVQRLIK